MQTDNTNPSPNPAEFDALVAAAKCERRFDDQGNELKPRHVYLDGSGKCECGDGPNLSERRMN